MAIFNGTDKADVFTGGDDADQIYGNGGNDTLKGGGGGNLIVGGTGADKLTGGADYDIIASDTGSLETGFNDTGTDKDTLDGGDGGDALYAGYGDNVDGGGGLDTLFINFQGATSGVTADFSQLSLTVGGGVIKNIESLGQVIGSEFGDTITVASRAGGYDAFTRVYGMGGNDHLIAGYYTDLLDGGAGDDIVDGRGSQYLSRVEGGDGNDVLYTNTNTFASAWGGAGADTIYAHGEIHGGTGSDKIYVQQSYYGGWVYGDAGNDLIEGTDAGTPMVGGAGADTLTGKNGADIIYSGDFVPFSGQTGDDTGTEKDVISAGGGNDEIHAGFGDTVDGGAGTDKLWLNLGGSKTALSIKTGGWDTASGVMIGGAKISDVETLNITGTALGDTFIVNGSGSQVGVNGAGGNDVIVTGSNTAAVNGGDGDDRIVSGIAADIIDGGAGFDTVDYSRYTDGVQVTIADPGGTGVGAGGDSLTGIERVIGTGFADTLIGNSGDEVLVGGADGDTLRGGAGSDVLDGGAGIDNLDGQSGGDIYYIAALADHSAAEISDTGSDGIDELRYAGTSAVTFVLDAGDTGLEQVVIGTGIRARANTSGTAAISIDAHAAGSGLTIIGNAGTNALTGTDFADTLNGGKGADTLIGGLGDDIYVVDNAGDTVSEAADGGSDLVRSGVSFTLGANVEKLTLTGSAAISGTGNALDNDIGGNAGANVLSGGDGADRIAGGGGNDTITGGAGQDLLTGGAGADTFVFAGGDFAGLTVATADRILDFSARAGDRIDLSAVDANSGAGGDQAFALIGTAAFSGAAGELRFEVSGTNAVLLTGDVDGDKAADFAILVKGAMTLAAGDLVL